MKRSTFLTLTAVIGVLAGLSFLFLPAQSAAGFGVETTPAIISLTRALGVPLLATAVLNWMVRNEGWSTALRAVLWANLLTQLLWSVTDLLDITSGIGGAYVWISELAHILLAIGFAYYLFARPAKAA